MSASLGNNNIIQIINDPGQSLIPADREFSPDFNGKQYYE
jgi:hypothetical protein